VELLAQREELKMESGAGPEEATEHCSREIRTAIMTNRAYAATGP
jgi:hypothetical protein